MTNRKHTYEPRKHACNGIEREATVIAKTLLIATLGIIAAVMLIAWVAA